MLAAAWVTALATFVLALSVPIAFVSWRNTRSAERIRLEREQEEALTKAIEQLSSHNVLVRVDGVYALERVARDSPKDYPRVMEYLTAFIREHSRKERPQPATDEPRTDAPKPGTDASDRATRPDVQAAITVIGRRDTRQYGQPIDLTRLDLTRLDLTNANLAHANLTDADLADANLTRANLRGADLGTADLTRANLTGADLTSANLTDTDLTRAILTGATLTDANFTRADLRTADVRSAECTGAYFANANLAGAILYDADLTGTYLANANLAGAHLNEATGANLTNADLAGATWREALPVPEGWVRNPSSGLLRGSDSDADDAG